MTHQRNAVLPLPVGTRVYNGDETAAIMASAGVDHYAHGGIVGDAIDWTKGKLSDIGSWIGDKLDAVDKFLKDPLGNISKLLHKATDGLFKGAASFGGLASGAIGKLSSIAVVKFKEMLNSTKMTAMVLDLPWDYYSTNEVHLMRMRYRVTVIFYLLTINYLLSLTIVIGILILAWDITASMVNGVD
ncbi:hypothetical protein [Companilactobacillus paralimentarius]|uniref:hypothetical protein n=1 Tax=Companilactobacillus paralimentarius TaxID=83526 RepID=UPI0038503064